MIIRLRILSLLNIAAYIFIRSIYATSRWPRATRRDCLHVSRLLAAPIIARGHLLLFDRSRRAALSSQVCKGLVAVLVCVCCVCVCCVCVCFGALFKDIDMRRGFRMFVGPTDFTQLPCWMLFVLRRVAHVVALSYIACLRGGHRGARDTIY